MINVKEATNKAVGYLNSFYQNSINIQLEEVELSEAKDYWFITLSYEENAEPKGYIFGGPSRKFKQFKIESDNGEFVSMKIREFK